MRVFKFGGASVKNAEAIRNVGTILNAFGGEEVLVVVSAMGKTTNALEALALAYFQNNQDKYTKFKEVKSFHDEIIKDLLNGKSVRAYDDIENLFIELECEIEGKPQIGFDQVYDQIVSYGEIFSSRILSTYLNEAGVKNRWMDAQNFIITDNTYREGKVNWNRTSHLIGSKLLPIVKKQMVVTQGFIGKNQDNFTVTLGREGSDYSAAIFAFGLHAASVTIWKDVAGVMNADPKLFPDAIKIETISYPKAIEMAYYGATVIHPKTIQPLQSKNIPLFVKSFVDPSAAGTTVGVENETIKQLPTIIKKGKQVLLSFSTKDFSFIAEENLSKLFSVFASFKIRINVMQSSAISFSVCVDDEEDKIEGMRNEVMQEYDISIVNEVELLTLINFEKENATQLLNGKQIILEQKTQNTLQLVIK
jgi:aspartate kinase